MQKDTDTFDNLVAGISLDERVTMLHQMKGQIKPEIEFLEKDTRKDFITIQTSDNLKKESFFLRFIITIKSIFTNKSKEILYADHQLEKLAKKTALKYPQYFNAQKLHLEKSFYDSLEELKSIAEFFKPSITIADTKPGEFLILLGSLILSDLERRIEDEANPYNHPFTQDVSNNLRINLLRTLEGILADVSSIDKAHLYTCVKSLAWLRDFCQLPFSDFQRKFNNNGVDNLCCGIRTCGSDVEKFANILSNSKNIEAEIIEALYLFSIQDARKNDPDTKVNIENHITTSLYHLKNLVSIINAIPFRALLKISKHSLKAEPVYNEKNEDWYIMYKEQWKKLFDTKWSAWQHDRNLSVTKKRVLALCNTNEYPLIPNRPWKKIQTFFQKEYTLGFLYTYLTKIYAMQSEVIKLLIMNGEFIIPENKIELMDTFSELNALSQKLIVLDEKLAPSGTYGTSFLKLKTESLYTMQGKSFLQSLLLTIVAEVDVLVLTFSNLIKPLQLLLNGILTTSYNNYYDGITNLATLYLPNRESVRKSLIDIKNALIESKIIIHDLASIELKGTQNDF